MSPWGYILLGFVMGVAVVGLAATIAAARAIMRGLRW